MFYCMIEMTKYIHTSTGFRFFTACMRAGFSCATVTACIVRHFGRMALLSPRRIGPAACGNDRCTVDVIIWGDEERGVNIGVSWEL